ncbi:hypothetical protein CHS0354_018289 [Potamilus streckersoni]|uniref:DUF5679 domain-containing protein n=1 Tax=Potamilus streckersoni TaxID=2493646 RepID=A0AAE0WED9_9BIVA|nr:hypothetical protein CHS0354_018289 [Potamilus streckersoni]
MVAYCLRSRQSKDIANRQEVHHAKGKHALQGICAQCGVIESIIAGSHSQTFWKMIRETLNIRRPNFTQPGAEFSLAK